MRKQWRRRQLWQKQSTCTCHARERNTWRSAVAERMSYKPGWRWERTHAFIDKQADICMRTRRLITDVHVRKWETCYVDRKACVWRAIELRHIYTSKYNYSETLLDCTFAVRQNLERELKRRHVFRKDGSFGGKWLLYWRIDSVIDNKRQNLKLQLIFLSCLCCTASMCLLFAHNCKPFYRNRTLCGGYYLLIYFFAARIWWKCLYTLFIWSYELNMHM